MLELKNIVKTYNPKKGKPVQALKDVSIKFDEKGMVFILGKSGCGKSTLLNVIGGLDKFDSGEIIIKGKSSKEFSGSDFDSYRNTFIGFIFQEYNILSEFNIEKNIALALELQGKKATPEKVQELLDLVDLGAQASRKTNELSGGQKQRVAIARALIKEPEIIIADEPTGALDSTTGAQVFDTLKKLSKEKLVIIVSHDREYAEIYADRIIEMKDGVILSDETKRFVEPEGISENINLIGDGIIRIAPNHTVSEEDIKKIVSILNSSNSEKIISCSEVNNNKFKKINKISDEGHTEVFNQTKPDDFSNTLYDKSKLKFIKSKLRYRDSFKMGASSLKTKPVRLFFTILLSLVSFTLFGLSDTLASYNKVNTTVQSLVDSDYNVLNYVGYKRNEYSYYENGELKHDYYYSNSRLNDEQLEEFEARTGLSAKPVFKSPFGDNLEYSLADDTAVLTDVMSGSYYSERIMGLIEFDEDDLSNFGCELVAGRLPNGALNEIAITKYTYELYEACGIEQKEYKKSLDELIMFIYKFNDNNSNGKIELSELTLIEPSDYSTMKKEEFLASGRYFSLYDTSKKLERVEDLFELTNENLIWSDEYTFENSFMIKVIIFDNIQKKSVTSYNDVIGMNICMNDYYNPVYLKIVGIVDTKLDSSKYESLKERAEKGYGEISRTEYTKMTKLMDSLNDGLHSLLFVSPGYIESNKADYAQLNFYSNEYMFYSVFSDFDGYEYKSELYFNRSVKYDPSNVLFKSEYSSLDSLNNDQFVLDFRFAFDEITRYMEEKGNADSNFYSTDEYLLFESYRNSINSMLNQNTIIRSTEFKNWLLKYEDKWNIYVGDLLYGEIIPGTSKRIVGLYLNLDDDSYLYGADYYLIGSDEFYTDHIDGVYERALVTFPDDESSLRELVKDHYRLEDDKIAKFHMQISNSVMDSIDFANSFIEITSKIFLYVGIFFAVFAGLMLANFISVSISYKKREIGILRAIGARKKDVFSIFFNESLVISFINFVLSAIATFIVVKLINSTLRSDMGLEITILIFGIRQVLYIAVVSLLVAFLASAIPVYKIAMKQPIDAINNR